MIAKIAVAGATAAAIIGAGTAALAASGPSGTTSGTPASSTANHGSSKQGHKHARPLRAALRHAAHGSLVTKGKDGYVTHSAIVGDVTAVSATSITVKAGDGYGETFSIGKDTKVRVRPSDGKGKATTGKVSDLKTGAQVAVSGKKPESSKSAPTAAVILDGVKKK